MKLKFNRKKVIPHEKDIVNIVKISLASLLSYFVLTKPINYFLPQLAEYPLPIKIMILVSLSYYFKGLIDVSLYKYDYF